MAGGMPSCALHHGLITRRSPSHQPSPPPPPQVHRVLPDMTPLDVVNVLYSLSYLRFSMHGRLATRLLNALLKPSASAAGQLQPHHLALAIWSVGRLGMAASPKALALLLQQAEPVLCRMTAQELSMLLIGLAKVPGDYAVPGSFYEAVQDAVAVLLPGMGGQDHMNVVWALGKLRAPLEEEWLLRVLQAGGCTMALWQPRELSATLLSLAALVESGQLRAVPPEWLESFWLASEPLLPHFSPQELSNVISSAAKLQAAPPAGWLAAWSDAVEARLHDFTGLDLVCPLHALTRLRQAPRRGWLDAFLLEAHAKVNDLYPQGMISIRRALLKLEQRGKVARDTMESLEFLLEVWQEQRRAKEALYQRRAALVHWKGEEVGAGRGAAGAAAMQR